VPAARGHWHSEVAETRCPFSCISIISLRGVSWPSHLSLNSPQYKMSTWTLDEIAEWTPEPDAIYEPAKHPLWEKALHMCVEASDWFVQEAVLESRDLMCKHACIIVVTDQGRLLFQNRREGRQGFGGGTYAAPLLMKSHSARRELFFEANLDVANPAVKYLSPPTLVTQIQHWERQYGMVVVREPYVSTCWTQIMVLRDSAVCECSDGRVMVGDVQLWSRELASNAGYRTRCPRAHQAAIHAGTWYWGESVYGVAHFDETLLIPDAWRAVDFNTMTLLRDDIKSAQQMQGGTIKAASFAGVSAQYAGLASVSQAARAWSFHMGDIAQERWPLLATPVLYSTIINSDWRAAAVAQRRSIG